MLRGHRRISRPHENPGVVVMSHVELEDLLPATDSPPATNTVPDSVDDLIDLWNDDAPVEFIEDAFSYR